MGRNINHLKLVIYKSCTKSSIVIALPCTNSAVLLDTIAKGYTTHQEQRLTVTGEENEQLVESLTSHTCFVMDETDLKKTSRFGRLF